MTKQPILIIGKNGKTGARVNARLNNMGFETCAVSRSASPVLTGRTAAPGFALWKE